MIGSAPTLRSRRAADTNKIVEKGKRAVVTGMSLMLCISARTHCILNRYCFVFRACAQNAAPALRLGSFFTTQRHSLTVCSINSGNSISGGHRAVHPCRLRTLVSLQVMTSVCQGSGLVALDVPVMRSECGLGGGGGARGAPAPTVGD